MQTVPDTSKCKLKDAIKQNHEELVGTLNRLEEMAVTCKEEKEKRQRLVEERPVQDEEYMQRQSASMKNLMEMTQRLLELKAARRREAAQVTRSSQTG